MKKPFRVLSIGLIAVVCALSLLLCACGNKKPSTPAKPTTYTVTYNLGGGEGTTPNGGSYEQGKTFTLAASTGITKAGYKFDKWNDGTADYAAGATYTMPAKNVTFTAKWTENKNVTVSFDLNGYGMPIAAQTVKEGEKITAPTAPEALYVTFDGWYKNAECTEAFDFNAGIASDGTAYAKWSEDESMPRGYKPERAKNIREQNDPDRMGDYIADGTTLYYTYTAAAAGRYAVVFEESAANKIAYTYTVSGDDTDLDAVAGEQSLYLTLANGQKLDLVVKVKDGVSLPVLKPIDSNAVLGVYVAVSDDEPLRDGEFVEGVYVGRAGAQDVYFRITDRAEKAYTISVGKEGSKVCTFKHVNGVVSLTDNTADWASGVGKMTWNADSSITFVSGEGTTATLRMWDADSLTDLTNGANSGTVNAQLGYAYFRVTETKSYKFDDADGLTLYGNVRLASPDAVASWTVLESGVAYDMTAGDVIAVKAASGSSVNFTVAVLPLLGTDASNPIIIRSSVAFDSSYVKNTTYYFKFVALEDGEYKFYTERKIGKDTYKGQSTYTGFQADGKWYNYNASGTYVSPAEYTVTLQAGEGVAIAVLSASPYADETLERVTLKVDMSYDLSNPADLPLDANYIGSVDASGNYRATISSSDIVGLVFTSDKAMDIVMSDGVEHGNRIELTTAQLRTAFKLLCTAAVQYAPIYRLGIESNPYTVSGTATQSIEHIGSGVYVEYTATESMSFRFGVSGNWTIKALSDEQEEADSELVLNLQENDVVRFLLTPAEGNSDGTTFTVTYDYISGATGVSFADNSQEAIEANANYVISRVDSSAVNITFTANGAFVIKFADGSDSIVGIVENNVATVTVQANKLKNGAYFRLSGADVQWTVTYKEGTAKNPYIADVMDDAYTRSYKEGEIYYVKITAPATTDVRIQPYFTVSYNGPRFMIDGTYYGFSDRESNSSSYALYYLLPAGESVVIALSYQGNPPPYVNTIGVGVWYSYADANATAFDMSNVENYRVYMPVTDVEIDELTFTASAPFAFTNVAAVRANYVYEEDKSDRIVATYKDGVYSYTAKRSALGKFAIDFMNNDSVTCTVSKYALGSVNNPKAVTLGESSVQYTDVYKDGKYYLQVTVPDAGKYVLTLGSSAYTIADLPDNGEVEFAAGALSKTFVVTADAAGTFTLKIAKVVNATELTFGMQEGAEGTGTTSIASGEAYKAGNVVVDADNDKFIYTISFTSSAAFTVAYADSAEVLTATLNGSVYKVTLAPDDAKRTIILKGDAAITYAVDWITGCVYNPLEVTAAGDVEIDYTADKAVYVHLANDSQFTWKVTVPSGYTVAGDATESEFTVSAGSSKSITVTGATGVQTTVGVLNDYADGAQTLAFDEDGWAEEAYINLSSEGKAAGTYIVGDTVVEGDLNDDVESIIFGTMNALKVTLSSGEVLTGFRVTVALEDMRRGVLVEGSDITYEIAWAKGSQNEKAELEVGENFVPFRTGRTSYATFTAGKAGYYTFKAAGFTVTVDGTQVAADEQVQLDAYVLVEITVSGSASASVVPLTVAYSAVAADGDFPEEMMGEWAGSGSYYDTSWGKNVAVKITIEFKAGRTATYTIENGTTGNATNVALTFTYSNGAYVATYANGSNTRTVTVWYDGNVVRVSDSYRAPVEEGIELIYFGGGEVELPTYIDETLTGTTWSCTDDDGYTYILEIGEKNNVRYVVAKDVTVFTDVTGTMAYNKETDAFELRGEVSVDLTVREDWGQYTLTLRDLEWMKETWTLNRSFSISSVGTWSVSEGGNTITVTIGYGTVHYTVTKNGETIFDENNLTYWYNMYTHYFKLNSSKHSSYIAIQESEWGLTLDDGTYLTEPMVLTKQ